jgi:hypothetical protein
METGWTTTTRADSVALRVNHFSRRWNKRVDIHDPFWSDIQKLNAPTVPPLIVIVNAAAEGGFQA